MAGITLRGRRNVCSGLGLCIHRCVRATVASRAVAGGDRSRRSRVAHDRGFKGGVVSVTGIALGSRWNVCRWLEYFRRATGDVARRTRPCCGRGMLVARARPHSGGCVAGVALRCGCYVRCRLCLGVNGRVRTAMTRRAVARCNRTGSARMAHHCGLKGGIVAMTGIALGRGRNMGRRLEDFRRAARDVTCRTGARRRGWMLIASARPYRG